LTRWVVANQRLYSRGTGRGQRLLIKLRGEFTNFEIFPVAYSKESKNIFFLAKWCGPAPEGWRFV
jgi:hypothetical protein